MKRKIITLLKIVMSIVLVIYIGICTLFYFYQEQLIFHPVKLASDYQFNFNHPFEEINLTTDDGVTLNALLFKSENPQGVVLYLHGNGGCLKGWGLNAGKFVNSNYDIFMLDYRGYGKSGGSITSEKQFYEDVELAYNELKKRYAENNIIVLGYSIGTAAASKIAAENNPKRLILKAPYVNLRDAAINIPATKYVALLPPQILKYKFPNQDYLSRINVPVTIFHGADDNLIYPGSSKKLKELLKPTDELFILKGFKHNNISRSPVYRKEIRSILTSN